MIAQNYGALRNDISRPSKFNRLAKPVSATLCKPAAPQLVARRPIFQGAEEG